VAPDNVPLDEVQRQVILATLRRTSGNIKEAAGTLGIDRSTLYDRMKKYGIER
jgi:transcriptional regulator of acetoin/glycerol metabolism